MREAWKVSGRFDQDRDGGGVIVGPKEGIAQMVIMGADHNPARVVSVGSRRDGAHDIVAHPG